MMVSQMPIGELGADLLAVLVDTGFPLLAALCIASGSHYLFVWGRHSWRRLRGEQAQVGDRGGKATVEQTDS